MVGWGVGAIPAQIRGARGGGGEVTDEEDADLWLVKGRIR